MHTHCAAVYLIPIHMHLHLFTMWHTLAWLHDVLASEENHVHSHYWLQHTKTWRRHEWSAVAQYVAALCYHHYPTTVYMDVQSVMEMSDRLTVQGRRKRSGQSGHGRTTFLASVMNN